MKLPEKKQRWVYHAEALPQAAGEGVTRRVLAYTDGLMCVENTFEKGAVGALHHHPHTQITYVVSGAFDFTVDGVTRTVRAGDTILKEDGVEHGCGSFLCTETQAAVEEAASEEAASEDAASLETSEAASEEEASLAASEEALFSSATAEVEAASD